jgi:hypothetical protein
MKAKGIVTGLVVVCGLVLLASQALADWNAGDPYKMHYPQLPDPNGLDVDFEAPHFLADDWRCTETGPVSDIHFWVSHRGGVIPVINGLQVEIFSNIPASPTGGFSMPGQRLWSAGGPLPFTDFDFATAPGGLGNQGWYDPYEQVYIPNDHDSYFQINLRNIKNPFTQKAGEIYWLGISIDTSNADGWKTSLNHFEDDAVYRSPTGGWAELRYPSADPRAGQSIDLAFVITPEPASLMIVAAGGLWVLGLRRQKRG